MKQSIPILLQVLVCSSYKYIHQ